MIRYKSWYKERGKEGMKSSLYQVDRQIGGFLGFEPVPDMFWGLVRSDELFSRYFIYIYDCYIYDC